MLRRQPTAIKLTTNDIALYEDFKKKRDAAEKKRNNAAAAAAAAADIDPPRLPA
ncbi:hypothetical protein EDC01DRAFT_778525 [Geopyxis carbonaria]|nr:hypothetical protein EDC01DRAFT_778525 [Geopyxis carbonaria]